MSLLAKLSPFTFGFVVSGSLLGQQLVSFNLPAESAATSKSTVVVTAPQTKQVTPLPEWERTFDRFVDLKDATFALRYRSVFDSNNAHEFNQGQQRSILDGKFKFDAAGRYGIAFHASSGHNFNWAYADFMGGGNEQALELQKKKFSFLQDIVIPGLLQGDAADVIPSESSGGWAIYVRRLYADLQPVDGLELQYGSLDINRGAASEITTYDYDGYIDGGRISIKKPSKLFFDEASVTYAYLGDLYKPNFFARTSRLGHSNYHQFLLRKDFSKRVDASLDYTWQDAANTIHEAANVRIPESRVVDSVRVEFYQRLNEIFLHGQNFSLAGGNGYAVTLNRKVRSRLQFETGMANIDLRAAVYTQVPIAAVLGLGVNGDQYGLGERYFVRPAIKLTPYMELSGYYTHGFGAISDPVQIVWNRQALNAGLVFDMRKALFHPVRTQ